MPIALQAMGCRKDVEVGVRTMLVLVNLTLHFLSPRQETMMGIFAIGIHNANINKVTMKGDSPLRHL